LKGQAPQRSETTGVERGAARRNALLAIAGVVAVAAVVVIFVLRPGAPGSPTAQVDAGDKPANSESNDLDLRDETFAVARKLVSDFPNDAVPLGLMGTVQNQFGNSKEAEMWWRRCLEKDPRRADIYEVLAIAFLRKGEYAKVAELMDKVQEIDLDLPGVHRRYAEALLEMGELDKAREMMEREMKITSSLGENYIVLGKIYFQQRKYEEAVQAYQGARRRRPEDSRVYYGLATATARLGRSERSREYMEEFQKLRAIKDDASTARRRETDQIRPVPKILAEALVDAGRVYAAYQQQQHAEDYWRRASALDPANTPSRIQLVNLYRRAGRAQEALELCGQLVSIDSGNASYHMVTGRTLADLGRFKAAEDAMRRTIELAPEDARGYRALTELLLRRKQKPAEAQAMAEKTVELAPTGQNYYLLGVACSQNKDRSGALAAMKRAAQLAPGNKEIQQTLEKLQETQ